MAPREKPQSPPGDGTLEAVACPSIVRDVADIVTDLHKPHILEVAHPVTDEKAALALVPEGLRVVPLKPVLDEFRQFPERRKGTAQLADLQSFVQHVNRFKDADSAIFASPDRARPLLTAVLDYHESVEDADDPTKALPRHGQHRSIYTCPLSEEWKAWTQRQGQTMSQTEFAEFIENHIDDVHLVEDETTLQTLVGQLGGRLAGRSALVELSRGLQVSVETAVQQAVTLATGEIAIKYVEQHTDGAGAPIKVPNLFVIAIPVFVGGDRYQIPVRLRYRLAGSRLTWHFLLYRADRSFDDAYAELCAEAAEQTGLPLYRGTPEQG